MARAASKARRGKAGSPRTDIPAGVTDDRLFALRWLRSRKELVGPLGRLYGDMADIDSLLGRLRNLLEEHWRERPSDLKMLDLERDLDPDWFHSEDMVAYVFYIDRFADRLDNVAARIPN